MLSLSIKMVAASATAVLAFCAANTAASAADLGPYKTYTHQEEAYDSMPALWQGLYAGVNGGYTFTDSGYSNANGFVGGGQLGYNFRSGSLVYGIEADFQGADVRGHEDFVSSASTGRSTTKTDWFSTVRGRIGFASGSTLTYLTGGVAFADIDNAMVEQRGPVTINYSSGGTKTGYVVGGGLEHAWTPSFSTKIEYLYIDYGSANLNGVGSDGNSYRREVENDAHVFRVGANVRF